MIFWRLPDQNDNILVKIGYIWGKIPYITYYYRGFSEKYK